MAKPGPKPTPTEVLNARGSWRGKARGKKQRTPPAHKRERPGDDKILPPAEAILKLPGYDPHAMADGYRFDDDRAYHAVWWFHNRLTHCKGALAGQPFMLEAWQQAIVANLFGWVTDDEEELRRFREAFIYVARKNGKSPMAAGLLMFMLFEDGEPGAEIYGAASEYKQASLVFEHARGMVLNEPELDERAQIFKGQSKAIQLEEDFSTYRVIASGADATHGFNTHAAVVDELHTQPDSELVDTLLTSTGARRNPVVIYITTADYARESICNEKLDYAEKVRDGIVPDPRYLPAVFRADKDDDWTKPETWAKANPNLDVSVSGEYLERECQRAQETPRYENTFKRLHLNLTTEQAVRWIPMEKWDACAGDLDVEALEGRPCFAALDLSTTTDITALGLFFPEDGNAFLPFFWLPEDTSRDRSKRDRVEYQTWAKAGLIELTPGNVVDQDIIRQRVNDAGERFDIQDVAVDPWNAAQLMTQLAGDGFNVVQFRQGYASMSPAAKELERMVVAGELRHGGNPVLRWMASNVAIEQDAAGNIKPSKKKSTERIDGIVTLVMAVGRAAMTPERQASVYEQGGITFL